MARIPSGDAALRLSSTFMRVQADRRPLFERFEGLREKHPLVVLAELPTPVRELNTLAERIGARSIWLKDDGPSSAEYGGNKVRKLELLLADAAARHASRVLTFGYAGSNHAAATAVHAARVGMRSTSMLLPQHNAAYLRKNLLVSAAAGAELHEHGSKGALAAASVAVILRSLLLERRRPYIIAPGGSSPLGTLGFVNAAFELFEQIEAGLLPVPARIYASAGSLGTVVGLGIGLAALGLPTRIIAVRVVDEQYGGRARAVALWKATLALLRKADASFPDAGPPAERVEFRGEFFGGSYAAPTPESTVAETFARELEALDLDITYTSKTMACLLADARTGKLEEPALFWNTCNSTDLSAAASRASPEDIPPRLRRYFEER